MDPASLDLEAQKNIRDINSISTPKFSQTALPPSVIVNLNNINQRAPWLSPETAMSLARSGVSNDAIDYVGEMSGQRNIDNYDQKLNDVGLLSTPIRWAYKGVQVASKAISSVYKFAVPGVARAGINQVLSPATETLGKVVHSGGFKTASRYTTASLDAIPETIHNIASLTTGFHEVDKLWQSYSLATLLEYGDQQGSGYFMSDLLRQEQAKQARAYRGVIDGSAFTIGRGTASLITPEGSKAYYYLSGLVDAIVLIASPDPTKHVGSLVKGGIGGSRALIAGESFAKGFKAKSIMGLIPLLSGEDAASIRAAKITFMTDGGAVRDLTGVTVRGQQFLKFADKNPRMGKLITRLVESDSPGEIMQDVFEYKISNDTALRLSQATNKDQVINALAGSFEYGDSTLSANIGKYKVSKSVLRDSIRKSRFFTNTPRSRVIMGGDDPIENADSLKAFVNSLQTYGESPERIKIFLDGVPAAPGQPRIVGAVEALSLKGSAVDRHNTLTLFKGYTAQILKLSGVEDAVANEIINGGRNHIDQVKNWFASRLGLKTDNGLLAMAVDQNKDALPPELFNAWFESIGKSGADVSLAQPMQIVDMLDRMVVLPDHRAIQRLTRNGLFSRLMANTTSGLEGRRKVTSLVSSKWGVVNRTDITDPALYEELTAKMNVLKSYEGPARTAANVEIDALDESRKLLEKHSEVWAATGEQRAIMAFIEMMQNRIWKPLNLATFGYILRNGMDAQVRMAFGGVTRPTHPFEVIQLLMGSKYGVDIKGVDISKLGKIKKAVNAKEDILKGREGAIAAKSTDKGVHAENVHEQLRDVLTVNASRQGFTASDTLTHRSKSGSFVPVTRSDGGAAYPQRLHTDGMVQQGQKAIADPLQHIAAMGISAGDNEEKIVAEIVEYLKDRRTKAWLSLNRQYGDGINYWRDGKQLKDIPKNLADLADNNPEEYLNILNAHARTMVIDQIKFHTGGIPELEFMYAHDAVPIMNEIRNIPVSAIPDGEKLRVGFEVTIEGKRGIVNAISKQEGMEDLLVFVPIEPGTALTKNKLNGENGARNARRTIENKPIAQPLPDGSYSQGLPDAVYREQMYHEIRTPQMDLMDNKAVNFFFEVLNDTYTSRLEKSPTFRTFYYRSINNHIDELSFEEGKKLHGAISEYAASEGKSIRQYLGESAFGAKRDQRVAAKIEQLPFRTNVKGTLTYDELDDYSRFRGLHDTKELLYDASNKQNWEDALRIISPFAGAWKDVAGNYLSLMLTDTAHVYRTSTRVFNGLQNADPDKDGRGIFYRDAQSNEMMFSFPLSGPLAKIFTGINAPIAGPLKRLSQGIGFYPAIGPWAQLAVSKLIPSEPGFQDFKQMILPYGSKGVVGTLNPLPGYLTKLGDGLRADTDRLTGTFFNSYSEVLRALSVNPKYQLSDPNSVRQLQADAKSRARMITMFRAATQFFGPTSGDVEIKIPTKGGDQFVSELMKQLRKFEDENYDTAVDKFLNLYGDETMLYLAAKSKATVKGLETSVEFDKWTQSNKDLIDDYPEVARYFAPKGDDFSFAVWQGQANRGERVNLTDLEIIAQAQKRLGSVKYRAARRMIGSFPNELQRQRLSDYRLYLNEELPGFPPQAEFVTNAFENRLANLRDMVDDDRVKNSLLTPLLGIYLQTRDQLMLSRGLKSLKSKKAMPLKTSLYQMGENYAMQNPLFARIWERELVQEVEQ